MKHSKDNKSAFPLSCVNENCECQPTETVMLARPPTSNALNRRAFIGTRIIAALALMLLSNFATMVSAAGENAVGASTPATLLAHEGSVNSIDISPDGKLLVSASFDKTIKLWSLPDGALIKTLEGHKDGISSVHISPDGKLLASGSGDKTIRLWSLPDGILIKTLERPGYGVFSVYISPDGKLLASSEIFDKTIKLWSLPEGALIKTLEGHGCKYGVFSMHISPDGKLLASGSWDKTISLWSLPDGKFISSLADTTLAQHGKGNDLNRDK